MKEKIIKNNFKINNQTIFFYFFNIKIILLILINIFKFHNNFKWSKKLCSG